MTPTPFPFPIPETPQQFLLLIYPVLKMLLEIFLFVYLIIALSAIKQISLMDKTVHTDTNRYLFFLAYLHAFIVGVLLIFVFLVL